MFFDIRRRVKGHRAKIVESGFATREEAKPRRNELNQDFYGYDKDGVSKVPQHNREFFVSRSHNHRHGASK